MFIFCEAQDSRRGPVSDAQETLFWTNIKLKLIYVQVS